jgi:hypothetical protein
VGAVRYFDATASRGPPPALPWIEVDDMKDAPAVYEQDRALFLKLLSDLPKQEVIPETKRIVDV